MIDEETRDEWREVAEAATPGEMYANTRPALRFKGTFDPPTVLALLDALDEAEQQIARVRAKVDEWERGYNSPTASAWSRALAGELRAALDGTG